MASFESIPFPDSAMQAASPSTDPAVYNQFGPSGQPRMDDDTAQSIAWLVHAEYATVAEQVALQDNHQANLEKLAADSAPNDRSTIDTGNLLNATSYLLLSRAINNHVRKAKQANDRANQMLATGTPLTGRRKLAS